jgi:lipid-A-disaccharide synthase
MIDAALRLRISDCGLRIEESTHSESQVSAIRNPNPQSAIRNPQSKDPQFVIPVATTIDREQVEAIVARSDAQGELDLAIVERDEYNALRHSEIAIVASGTATVEAAILGTPMVIVYRGSELNWRLIRPLIKLDTFGMVNLIAGRRIAPELMQQDVTGEKIAREVGQILGDPSRLAQMKRDLAIVRERLESGNGSASERAAATVMQLIADA